MPDFTLFIAEIWKGDPINYVLGIYSVGLPHWAISVHQFMKIFQVYSRCCTRFIHLYLWFFLLNRYKSYRQYSVSPKFSGSLTTKLLIYQHEIWHRTANHRSAIVCQFLSWLAQMCKIMSHKTINIRNFAAAFAPSWHFAWRVILLTSSGYWV